jgi:hypothetical protein
MRSRVTAMRTFARIRGVLTPRWANPDSAVSQCRRPTSAGTDIRLCVGGGRIPKLSDPFVRNAYAQRSRFPWRPSGQRLAPAVESTFQLIERVREGDREALKRRVARHVAPLRRWVSGRLPRWARDLADTDDLVQDTLLRTFKNIAAFEPWRRCASGVPAAGSGQPAAR